MVLVWFCGQNCGRASILCGCGNTLWFVVCGLWPLQLSHLSTLRSRIIFDWNKHLGFPVNPNVTLSSLQRCSNSNTTWHPSFVFTFFHFFAFFRSFDLNLDSFSLSFTSTNACKNNTTTVRPVGGIARSQFRLLFTPFHFFLSHLFSPLSAPGRSADGLEWRRNIHQNTQCSIPHIFSPCLRRFWCWYWFWKLSLMHNCSGNIWCSMKRCMCGDKFHICHLLITLGCWWWWQSGRWWWWSGR